jgi:hypothetical protein
MTASWKIASALGVIFLSGGAAGYFASQWRNSSRGAAGIVELSASPAAAADDWSVRALEKLRGSLDLTPEQEKSVHGVLQRTGERLEQQKERALFQLHLQILAAHDEMRPLLHPEQAAKLDRLQETLRRQIRERFSSLWSDPTQAPPPL